MPTTIIPPEQTLFYRIAGAFACEPMKWRITTNTTSDACLVKLKIWTTWVEGMKSKC